MSDIDTAAADSLKALDPKRPIREADIEIAPRNFRFRGVKQILKFEGVTSACDPKRTNVPNDMCGFVVCRRCKQRMILLTSVGRVKAQWFVDAVSGEKWSENWGTDSTMMARGVDGDTTRGDLLQAHFNYNCKRLSS